MSFITGKGCLQNWFYLENETFISDKLKTLFPEDVLGKHLPNIFEKCFKDLLETGSVLSRKLSFWRL